MLCGQNAILKGDFLLGAFIEGPLLFLTFDAPLNMEALGLTGSGIAPDVVIGHEVSLTLFVGLDDLIHDRLRAVGGLEKDDLFFFGNWLIILLLRLIMMLRFLGLFGLLWLIFLLRFDRLRILMLGLFRLNLRLLIIIISLLIVEDDTDESSGVLTELLHLLPKLIVL